jgi:hypothetical protein
MFYPHELLSCPFREPLQGFGGDFRGPLNGSLLDTP